ncbi:twin-arginine translocation signal domain-containing protein [Amycolatopsis anabasis]|uniref:twin-arginine translocation signal domain-containing protein n=1 Tax=Amycolatopsis anabasis TaxID=1840409 RepID=UPI00131D384B|nr:twin-arginine translocation signal domain-containing protein [Amycolatopsis anabasis]
MPAPNDDELDQSPEGTDRRKFLKGAAAAAVGGVAAAGGLLGTPEAWGQSGLPPIGAEIPCSCLAINTPLQIRTALVSVDFRGGIKVRVDVNPDDPVNSVRLRVVGHKVSGELPDVGDGRQGGGTITIEQNDVDVDAKSLLRLTQRFPPRYEQIMVLSFTMTIDQPDDLMRRAGVRAPRIYEPLVLTTKEPAQLIGKLTQFPPRGDLYKLQNPVDLILPDDPDTTIATIERFPVKVGGL